MKKKKKVRLILYRYAGRFLFFQIKKSCKECDITYALLQRILAEELRGKEVTLKIVPWLNNWWKVIWRGGWHAPILTVNGFVFSQGIVPDIPKLLKKIGRKTGDEGLLHIDLRINKIKPSEKKGEIVVYHSPACPHCRKLIRYLDANGIVYVSRDVTETETSRNELLERTRGLNIPVILAGDEIIRGFDRVKIRSILGISEATEKTVPHEKRSYTPSLSRNQLFEVLERAKKVLEGNRVDRWTRPSKKLYPHLWNWDSGFTARGYLHYDPAKAYQEIRALFQAQWSDGFLPHILFNNNHLYHFPGPEYWKAERSGKVPEGCFTSGISQPPVHATMISRAFELDPDKDRALTFLREFYPRIKKLHDFYLHYRDPASEGLVTIVHPWESGLDNAPLWDKPLAAIKVSGRWALNMQRRYDDITRSEDRPKRSYIGKYSYLIQNLLKKNYDWHKILRDHPFLIQGVLFNTILCQSEKDLGKIAKLIGADAVFHSMRADKIASAINRKLWCEEYGIYYNFDLVAQKQINRDTIFSYMPFFAGIPDKERGERLLDSLRTHCFCIADSKCVAVPSYDMCQADFEGEFYWRGPVWVNINWYLARGLAIYDEQELSDWIDNSLIDIANRNGFYEYYDPDTGKGLGEKDFSWTAALIIDLVSAKLNLLR